MAKPRVKVPKTASAGEVVTIKTLIDHKMDSGQAKDKEGNIIPRKIINTFSATFNGAEVLTVNLEPAVSTNPYFQFSFKVPETGEIAFKWIDDDGTITETSKTITVE
jgi:sulfur-oxidizing protein SoxZ